MKILSDYNLFNHNTFRLNSIARYFFELNDTAELPELKKWAKARNVPIRILGGGSNLILPDQIEALVLKNNLKGIQKISESETLVTIQCASGENWHQFVMNQISEGHFGLENLALIPGTVGGAPIQNIGAYGIEVNRFIQSVTGYDLNSGTTQTLENKNCLFEYRNSIFKSPTFSQFFVTSVQFNLLKLAKPVLNYTELAQTFVGQAPTALEVALKVIEVRQRKLPDVNLIPNVGSFFKNPIISQDQLARLQGIYPDLVSYTQADGRIKLAAGQLIEKLGFKGRSLGSVGMYDKQALVMVNLGDGRVNDIKSLVLKIVTECKNRFQVDLETEPIFW